MLAEEEAAILLCGEQWRISFQCEAKHYARHMVWIDQSNAEFG